MKYQPFDWLMLRYATTKTLTRPNYSDMIPLYNISGQNRTVVYRNPFLEPGISKNQDYVISFNNKYDCLIVNTNLFSNFDFKYSGS